MYHLKTIVSRSATIAAKQQLIKVAPVTLVSNRNYADHQIPDRLKDVATARGEYFRFAHLLFRFLFHFFRRDRVRASKSTLNLNATMMSMMNLFFLLLNELFRSTILRHG